MVANNMVMRLIDAKDRGHITQAQFEAALKAGNKLNTRVTVVVDVEAKKEKKSNR